MEDVKNKVKLIAFYLPQYHSIPENDKFWGKGFTDWTNVKKSKPLFKGHNQPRVPLNNNYYSLLDKDVLDWQAKLARQYGIHGFCFYHYWFQGKNVLEKPAELLLTLKDVDMNFCFSWANEPWTRTWDGGNKNILIPQGYGDRDEWIEHFNYLLLFFKDKRYIKVDNQPVFLIYRTSSIDKIDEMITLWNTLAKKEGFNGIYFLETLNSFQNKLSSEFSNGFVEFQPACTWNYEMIRINKGAIPKILKRIISYIRNIFIYNLNEETKKRSHEWIRTGESVILKILRRIIRRMINIFIEILSRKAIKKLLDYDYFWQKILQQNTVISNKRRFLGAFIDFDNSARQKRNSATIFTGANPEKFQFYLSEQIKKSKEINSEFLFINAWNEWAEGAYLEPDEKWGYKYLEAVRSALSNSEQ